MDTFPNAAQHCRARREPLSAYLDQMDHVSSSMLRRFARTGSMQAARTVSPPGRDAALGDALHALLLEPERFDACYFETEDGACPRHVPGPDDLLERTWLSVSQSRALRTMCNAVHQYAREPLVDWLGSGHKELSIYWSDEAGDRFKARPDCFCDDVVLELKTASDIRPGPFERTRRRFGYDLQAAHYLEGITRLTGHCPRFLYLAVESIRPHSVWVYELGYAEIERARTELSVLTARFRAHGLPAMGVV